MLVTMGLPVREATGVPRGRLSRWDKAGDPPQQHVGCPSCLEAGRADKAASARSKGLGRDSRDWAIVRWLNPSSYRRLSSQRYFFPPLASPIGTRQPGLARRAWARADKATSARSKGLGQRLP